MDAPQIQYTQTEDGVSIAYTVMGEGPPLLHAPTLFGDIAREAELPDKRAWHDRLAQTHTLICYDPRGSGSSDRDALMETIEHVYRDIAAVMNAVPFDQVDIIGSVLPIATATILYSARHPERVRHLILWATPARGQDWIQKVSLKATRALIDQDFRTYTNAWAQAQFGWAAADRAQRWARLYRHATGPEAVMAALNVAQNVDVSDCLPRISASTLVVGHNQPGIVTPEGQRLLVTQIPNARLVVRPGIQYPPWGDPDSPEGPARVIDDFIGIAPRVAASPADTDGAELPSGTAIILFLDIAGSTELTSRLGDAAYRGRERDLDAKLRDAISGAGGTPVEGKVLGDGIMSVFTSARQAIEAAQRCRDLGNDAELTLHLGIHAGDIVREGNNVHGGAVQLASRVVSVAAPGEILVSATVRDLARTSAGVAFDDRGEYNLKGIDEPQRLFAVREQE